MRHATSVVQRVLVAAALSVCVAIAGSANADPAVARSTMPDVGIESAAVSFRADMQLQNTAFNLSYGGGLTGNPAAQAAFQAAANRWSALLGDPVTVNLTVDYQPLGAGILGSTGSTSIFWDYTHMRDLVAGGGEGKPIELALLPNLPTVAQFTGYLPSGFAFNGNVRMTQANWKALGQTQLTGNDGSITFSSNFSWDFDPSDGITPGTYDFVGIAQHEMGHALGFISEEDYVDSVLHAGQTASDVEPYALDFFRFRTSDLGAGFDFTTTARDFVPGGSQSFYYLDNSVLMSTGRYNGDGRQASHLKDQVPSLGIMDPTAASGELLAVQYHDLIAFDLIGWDVQAVPEPATVTLLSMGALGVFGFIRRQRRK